MQTSTSFRKMLQMLTPLLNQGTLLNFALKDNHSTNIHITGNNEQT